MGPHMMMLLMIASGFSLTLSDKSSEAFTFDGSLAHISTYITTESYVYHMEMDQFTEGNILFSDAHSLKSTDGNMTLTIAGQATASGYREGLGEAARLNLATGFYQISRRKVVVADFHNHCLRLVDRPTGQTKTHSGTCTKPGYADGSHALFDNPYSIIPDNKNRGKVLVTDRMNNAVRQVDIESRIVSTYYKDRRLTYIFGITQDVARGDLYLTSYSAVYQLHHQNRELTLLAGSSTKNGYRDGDFSVSQFNDPRELLLIDEGKRIIVADLKYHGLRVLNRDTNTTSSFCGGTSGHTDGDVNNCSLFLPHSLMVLEDSLYIGETQRIRKLSGRKLKARTPTTTSEANLETQPPATIRTNLANISTMSPCPPGNVAKQLEPGEKTVVVEISPGQSLQLPAGDYIYKLNSELSNCTVGITVTEEILGCPERLLALTSPHNGLATFQLRFGAKDHIILLPIGRYAYMIKSQDQICNVTLIAQDYRVRHTLELVADYTVDCSIVTSTMTWRMLEDVAKQRYSIIEELCGSVCKRPASNAQPILACDGVDDLKIRWPTDLVFPADVVSIPASIHKSLDERITVTEVTLDVVVFAGNPMIVKPEKAANGGFVTLALSKTCINGQIHSDVEGRCV